MFNFFSKKTSKIAVYTAIYGEKDDIKDIPRRMKDIDFICFTDNRNVQSKFFKVNVHEPISQNPIESAKIYKIMPHLFLPDYEYSIWVDGNIILKDKFPQLIDLCISKNYEMTFIKHPERSCIYEEAEACIRLNKDNESLVKRQIEKYRHEGYPENNGLISGGVIFRKNKSEIVKKINDNWWKEIKNNSLRDQLSFNYIAWKNNFTYGIIEENLWDNQYFKVSKHKS